LSRKYSISQYWMKITSTNKWFFVDAWRNPYEWLYQKISYFQSFHAFTRFANIEWKLLLTSNFLGWINPSRQFFLFLPSNPSPCLDTEFANIGWKLLLTSNYLRQTFCGWFYSIFPFWFPIFCAFTWFANTGWKNPCRWFYPIFFQTPSNSPFHSPFPMMSLVEL